MSKEAFERVKAGLEEALAFVEGTAPPGSHRVHVFFPKINVREVRKKTRLSQAAFAHKFGFTVARLRDWEQGRSAPDGALSAYLKVIDNDPKAVERALAS